MKVKPLVSVIIPLYNGNKYIAETLDSLVYQDYSNFEVIVVDNASTDNSVEIVEKYFDKLNLTVVKCSVNSGGPAKPRNIGIDKSSGEYIAFLDADDIWLPNKLSYQIEVMITLNNNFTCVSPLVIDDKSKNINRLRDISFLSKNKFYGLRSLLFRNTITTSSVVIRKDFLSGCRFNETANFITCEDYFLWLNLFNKENVSFLHIAKKLVKYRVVSSSLGSIDGKYMFAVKSLQVSSVFLVEKKRQDLIYVTVFSSFFRFLKLLVLR